MSECKPDFNEAVALPCAGGIIWRMEYDPRDRAVSVDEAATVLEVEPRRVRRWIAEGIINPEQVGRDYIIRWVDIEHIWEAIRTGELPP